MLCTVDSCFCIVACVIFGEENFSEHLATDLFFIYFSLS